MPNEAITFLPGQFHLRATFIFTVRADLYSTIACILLNAHAFIQCNVDELSFVHAKTC